MTQDLDRDINLLEQIHVALGSASKLEDFYVILASMLVDPNSFGFSRAFLLRYDERSRSYNGRIALGASSAAEHEQFLRDLAEETRILQQQILAIQSESPEPRAIQSLYNLRFHSLWIHLVQGVEEGTGLNAAFKNVHLRGDLLGEQHLLHQAAQSNRARLVKPEEVSVEGLEDYLVGPAICGRLVTKRGLHGVLIADNFFGDTPLDDEFLVHFQWLLNQASVTLDNVELVEDLTATTQRLQDVDRLKSSFLSIVSHELRTPLTSIVGFSQLLAEERVGPLTDTQRDLLRRVSGHAGHLQSMVNDLLEIAEVEAGGMLDLSVEPVDPLACFWNIQPKIEARRGAKNVRIVPLVTGSTPNVLANSSALERILYHLLDNAVKFTEEGTVTVEFRSEPGELQIVVADEGIGIPPDNLRKIFDYFYQVDFRLERSYGGMGIGLTVVKLLLDATGGRIAVESQPGQGSRFTLTYPVEIAGRD